MPADIRHTYRVDTAEARRRIREFRDDVAASFKDFDTGAKRAQDGFGKTSAAARSTGATVSSVLSQAGGIGADAFKRQQAAIFGAMKTLQEGGQKGTAVYKQLLVQATALEQKGKASGLAMSAAFQSTAQAGARAKAALDAQSATLKRLTDLERAHGAAIAENARREAAAARASISMGRAHAAALAENAVRDVRPGAFAGVGQALSASGVPGASALASIGAAAGPIAAATLAVAALGAAMGVVTSRAVDFESAFAGVRKTVEASEPEYAAIREQILALSTEIPQSAGELAKIAATAGQFGIAKGDLVEFTKTVANLGVAVDGISAEDAAGKLAQIGVVTHSTTGEVERMASVLVELGNKGNSTEAQILDLAKRIAAAGNDAGLSKAAIFGFAGAIANAGIEAEAGGTAFSKSIRQMGMAVAAGGSKLEGFAKIAHTSSAGFAQAFGRDPQQAMVQFLEGLAKIKTEGGNVGLALEEIGIKGARQIDTLSRLSQNTGQVVEQLRLANAEYVNNNALNREAEERYKTTASQIQLLKNSLERVAIALGDQLLPVTKEILLAFRDIVDGDFPAEFARFVVEFVKLNLAINPLLIPLRVMGALLSWLAGLFDTTFGDALTGALSTAATAMETFNLSFERILKNTELFAIETGIAIADGIVGPLAKRLSEMAPMLSKIGSFIGGASGGALSGIATAAAVINNNLATPLASANEKARALTNQIRELDDKLRGIHSDKDIPGVFGPSIGLADKGKLEKARLWRLAHPAGQDDEGGGGGGPSAMAESWAKRNAKALKDLQLDTLDLGRAWENAADLSAGGRKRLEGDIIKLVDRYAEMGETVPAAFQKIADAAKGRLDFDKLVKDSTKDFTADLKVHLNDRLTAERLAYQEQGRLSKEAAQQEAEAFRAIGLESKKQLEQQGEDLVRGLTLAQKQGDRTAEAMAHIAPEIASWVAEAKRAGVEVPPAMEAIFNTERAKEFGQTVVGIFQTIFSGAGGLKSALGGLGNDLLGGLLGGSKAFGGSQLGGLFKEGGPLGGLAKAFSGSGIGKLFGGEGFASNLGGKLAGSLAGAGTKAFGALSGIFTAGIGTAISLGAPALIGGLKKLFGGTPEWKKVAKDAGRMYGVDISEETAKAIVANRKKLGVSRGIAEALALPDIAKDATITGANLGKFTSQFDVLLKTAAAGGKGAAEALKAAGAGFDVLVSKAQEAGATGTKAFGDMMRAAKAAGLEQFKAFAGQQVSAAGGFLGTILDNARIGKGGEGLASLGGLSGGLLEALKGLPGAGAAIDALGPSLDKIAEKAKAAGQALPDGIAGLIGERDFRKANADLFATTDALAGFTKSLGEAGFIGANTFTAIEDQVKNLNGEFIAAGKSQADSLAIIAPTLQEIVNEHQRNGTAIDAETQALIDQAAGMGLVKQEGTGLINVLQQGFNAIITQLGGDPIFGQLKPQIQEAVNAAQSGIASLGSAAEAQAQAVAGGISNIAEGVANSAGAAAASALEIIRRVRAEGGTVKEALQEYYRTRHEGRDPEPETHAGGGPVYGRGVAGDGEYVVSKAGRRAAGDAALDAINRGGGGAGGTVNNVTINVQLPPGTPASHVAELQRLLDTQLTMLQSRVRER